MSDYGLKILNTAGGVQIDSTYKNYMKLAVGSVGISVGSNNVDITDTSKIPIIAFRPTSGEFSCHYGFTKSGADFTHAKFMCGANSITCYWKEYVEGQVLTLPEYGLVVYNPSGAVVFSSEDYPMNIISINTGSFAYSVGGGAYADETVVDADNNYFIIVDIFPLYYEGVLISNPPPVYAAYYYTRGLKYINSTTIRVGQFVFGGVGGSGYPPASYDGWINAYTLIEVKG